MYAMPNPLKKKHLRKLSSFPPTQNSPMNSHSLRAPCTATQLHF